MFDHFGNATNSNDDRGDYCIIRKNHQSPVTSSLPSSRDNNSRKRKLVSSENSSSTSEDQQQQRQQQQNRASSIQEFKSFLRPNKMTVNDNSNISQQILLNGGGFNNLSNMIQISSSRSQDMKTSSRGGVAALPDSTQSSPLLGDPLGVDNSTLFTQGLSNGSILSSMPAMNDPSQGFLRNYLSPDGDVLHHSSTFNGTRSKSKISDVQSTIQNDSGNVSQLSALSQQEQQQQRSENTLQTIPTIPNNFSGFSNPMAHFQFGKPSLLSHTIPTKQNIQNILSDSIELTRNNPVMQQQMLNLNNSIPPHLVNVTADAHLPSISMTSIIPFPITSNSVPINELLLPSNIVRSTGNSQHITARNKSHHPSVNDHKDWTTNISDSLLYDCDVGRSKPLFLPCDSQTLSEYQCLLRKQIELFEATEQDIKSSTKGRNKPIFLGQVGVRCIHCRNMKPENRNRGATYYPATLKAMYQSGQTMAIRHLRSNCVRIPINVRDRLSILKEGKSSAGGGKKYWSDAASVLGVYVREEGGLRFESSKTTKSAQPSDQSQT